MVGLFVKIERNGGVFVRGSRSFEGSSSGRVLSPQLNVCAVERINYKYRRNKELSVGTEPAKDSCAPHHVTINTCVFYVRKESGRAILIVWELN